MATGDQGSRRSERRWAQRYSFRADLEIEWGSAVLRGSTRDISSNGMFIESSDTLWVVERPVKLDCSVKRVEPGRGMGVTIAVSETENQKRYQDLLSTLSRGGAS